MVSPRPAAPAAKGVVGARSLSATAADFARARRMLARRDPVLGAIIRSYGPDVVPSAEPIEPFTALLRVIVGQQLSVKAAATIFGRFAALVPGAPLTPDAIAAVDEARLRSVGLSRQKVAYVRDLCARVSSGSLPLDRLTALSDDEVSAALIAVKGLGRWSADMFLMFRLRRPDILPVGDLGIVRAIQRAYGLRKPPTAARMEKIAEAWRPYRTVACWYLWASLDNTP